MIHSTQQAFRKILDSMSFPGKLNRLDQWMFEMPPLLSQTALVCQTLLDSEVTFVVLENPEISKSIHAYTGSHVAEVSEADFLIIPINVAIEKIVQQLKKTKTGDLRDPQKSATILYEVESLAHGTCYELKGPGIKKTETIFTSIPEEVMAIRAEINAEYPLGIDFLFIDQDGNLLALPRTTKVSEVERVWGM